MPSVFAKAQTFDFTSLRQGQFLANAFFNLILKQKKQSKMKYKQAYPYIQNVATFLYFGDLLGILPKTLRAKAKSKATMNSLRSYFLRAKAHDSKNLHDF